MVPFFFFFFFSECITFKDLGKLQSGIPYQKSWIKSALDNGSQSVLLEVTFSENQKC